MPDGEAAIRLVETVDALSDLGVDTGPLVAFVEDVGDYYAELREHLERRAGRDDRSMPEDRMFM